MTTCKHCGEEIATVSDGKGTWWAHRNKVNNGHTAEPSTEPAEKQNGGGGDDTNQSINIGWQDVAERYAKELEQLRTKNAELEGQCGVMREALEDEKASIIRSGRHHVEERRMAMIEHALHPNSGLKLLEQLETAREALKKIRELRTASSFGASTMSEIAQTALAILEVGK